MTATALPDKILVTRTYEIPTAELLKIAGEIGVHFANLVSIVIYRPTTSLTSSPIVISRNSAAPPAGGAVISTSASTGSIGASDRMRY